jgi:hypothetical protein
MSEKLFFEEGGLDEQRRRDLAEEIKRVMSSGGNAGENKYKENNFGDEYVGITEEYERPKSAHIRKRRRKKDIQQNWTEELGEKLQRLEREGVSIERLRKALRYVDRDFPAELVVGSENTANSNNRRPEPPTEMPNMETLKKVKELRARRALLKKDDLIYPILTKEIERLESSMKPTEEKGQDRMSA